MPVNQYVLPHGRTVMTGANPSPKHVLAAAPPWRIRGATPPAFLRLPSKLSMWLNDTYGDCVTAEEAFAKACNGIFISDSEVKRWAQSHGVLNGADLSSVLDWMAQKGFQQDGNTYNDGPKASVDWTNLAVLQNAIYYGTVKIAVAAGQLSGVVTSRNGWVGTGFRRDNNSDHSTSVPGFGPVEWLVKLLGGTLPSGMDGSQQGVAFYTWDTVGVLDYPSFLAITDEAWTRTPGTITVGTTTPTADTVTETPPRVPPGPAPTENSLVLAADLPPGTYNVSNTQGVITVVSTIPAGNSLIVPDFFV
jgi:hypothetical protein